MIYNDTQHGSYVYLISEIDQCKKFEDIFETIYAENMISSVQLKLGRVNITV
jgi:hypothetical protein